MINKRITDRRSANRDIEFPLTDGSGIYVGADRRSGFDRRNSSMDEIALKIISLTKS